MKHLHPQSLLIAAALCIGMAACTDPLTEPDVLPDNTHGATVPVTLGFSLAAPTPGDGFSGGDSGITAVMEDWDTSTTSERVGTP